MIVVVYGAKVIGREMRKALGRKRRSRLLRVCSVVGYYNQRICKMERWRVEFGPSPIEELSPSDDQTAGKR